MRFTCDVIPAIVHEVFLLDVLVMSFQLMYLRCTCQILPAHVLEMCLYCSTALSLSQVLPPVLCHLETKATSCLLSLFSIKAMKLHKYTSISSPAPISNPQKLPRYLG